jgi:RimJ/RimL family protein N-acetyltransferase
MDDIIIRRARPDDAGALLDHIRRLLREPGVPVPLQPDEFHLTVEEERAILSASLDSSNSVFLLAESAGRVVGELSCKGGTRRAFRHAATLGMSVSPEWRGRGIGSRLMSAAVEWARSAAEIARLELFVFAGNAPAIALYQKFGFVEEGRRRSAILHEGRFVDDLMMARMVSRDE